MKLIHMGTDRRKSEAERFLFITDDLCADILESKTVASALKHYLRNLAEPLMTFRYHNGFIAAVKQDTRIQRISDVHTLMHRLPKPNMDMLEIVIRHLKAVSIKCHKNKMSVFNLGVVFGPTLLRAAEETLASILDIKFNNVVIEILIENYDLIFKSPSGQQSGLIANASPSEPVPRNHFRHRSSGHQQMYGGQQQQSVIRAVAKSNFTDQVMSSSMLNIPNGLQQISSYDGGGVGSSGSYSQMMTNNNGGNHNILKIQKESPHQIYESAKIHKQSINSSTPSLIQPRDIKMSPREISLSREYLNQPSSLTHSTDSVHGTSNSNNGKQYRKNSLMTSREMTLLPNRIDGGIYGSAQHLGSQKLSYTTVQQTGDGSVGIQAKKLYPLKDQINSTSSSNESMCSMSSRDLNITSFNNFMATPGGASNTGSRKVSGYSATPKTHSPKGGGDVSRGNSGLYEDPSQVSSPKKTQRKQKNNGRHLCSSSVDNV